MSWRAILDWLSETPSSIDRRGTRTCKSNQKRRALVKSDKLVIAIGDIHGRADLLNGLVDKVLKLDDVRTKETHIIFLGDYIDRGPDSKSVIDKLIELQRLHSFCHFIRGNHDESLLEFLETPDILTAWLKHGGRETLASYGLVISEVTPSPDQAHAYREAFAKLLPQSHLDFFRNTLFSYRIDKCFFCHAGIDPNKPFSEQSPRDLMWIRDKFLQNSQTLSYVVVHGHTPVEAPVWDGRRIAVDTGAYVSNRLTAALITKESVKFMQNQLGSSQKYK